jgi:HEAT repeat protein
MTAFNEALEKALSRSEEEFLQAMTPLLASASPDKLETLAQVLEHGSVVDKSHTTKLFITVLGDVGAEFLKTKLDTKRPRLFKEAAEIIGSLGYSNALESLKKGISEKHPELVLSSVKAISRLCAQANTEAQVALTDFYLNFKDEVMLTKSIKYLLPHQERLADIFLKAYEEIDEERKMWVLKLFAQTANEKLVNLYERELDAHPLERGIYCLAGLGKIGNDAAVKVLGKHLVNEEWFFRKHLVAALGATGNKNAVEPLLGFLKDPSQQVQGAAVESLSKLGNQNPEIIINKLLKGNRTEQINLIRAMGQLKNPKFLPPLLRMLGNEELHFFTIDALGDLGVKEAEPALRELLKSKVWFNRLNALEALAKLELPNMLQLASDTMQDENDMVRNSAFRIHSLLKSSQGNTSV